MWRWRGTARLGSGVDDADTAYRYYGHYGNGLGRNAMKFMLAGGGTGGHIYPALAIGEELLRRYPDAELLFVGGRKGLERTLVPRAGHRFVAITVAGFERRLGVGTFVTAAKAVAGLVESLAVVARFRPDVAIGTGGYASGPAILAASLLRMPVLVHEQNVVPGATNRLLASRARTVAVSWAESIKMLPDPSRAVLTGNPIRREIVTASKRDGLAAFRLSADRPVVLIIGGSQGARSINAAAVGAIPQIVGAGGQLLLATGPDKFGDALAGAARGGTTLSVDSEGIARSAGGDVIVMPYIYSMPQAMACADLVVARSGAITLAEIAARGLPSILVPHPKVPDNVQEKNARALEARGAAMVILDRELTPESLGSAIAGLLADAGRRRSMSRAAAEAGMPDATAKVVDCIEGIIGGGHGGKP